MAKSLISLFSSSKVNHIETSECADVTTASLKDCVPDAEEGSKIDASLLRLVQVVGFNGDVPVTECTRSSMAWINQSRKVRYNHSKLFWDEVVSLMMQ